MSKILSRVMITTVISFGILLTVFGGTSKSLKVYYDNITIFINGKELHNKETANNDTEPFINNGVTFVPLRLVSEALNCKVEWIDESKSILITTPNPVAVLGTDGLYAAHSEGGGIKLGDKITDEVFEWAYALEDNSYIVLTQAGDGKPEILKKINGKGETVSVLLDVTKFKELVFLRSPMDLSCVFKNGKVEIMFERQEGISSIETYVYSIDILSRTIEVVGFTPGHYENLGSFNGNIEDYNAFIATKIKQEQDIVNTYLENTK